MKTIGPGKKDVRFHIRGHCPSHLLLQYKKGYYLNFGKFCKDAIGDSKTDQLKLEAQNCLELADGEVDMTVDIFCTNWKNLLLRLMETYELSIMKSFPPHLTPIVTIPAKKSLKKKLTTDHLDLKLHAIYWCNFVNRGLLMIHWEISYYTKTRDTDLVTEKFIKADFLHDECFALFHFMTSEKDPVYMIKGKETNTRSFRYYTLKMFYKTIKRIVVDLTATESTLDSKEHTAYRVHFVVSSPLVICKMDQKKKDELERRGEVKYGDGQRWTMIHRGRTFFEDPVDKSVFSDNTVFSIVFLRRDSEELYELLSRIFWKSQCQVDFAPIKMVYGLLTKPNSSLGDGKDATYINIHDPKHAAYVQQMLGYKKDIRNLRTTIDLFPLWYLLEGLMSRGAVVKDQILLNVEQYYNFLNVVLPQYKDNRMRCEWALEELMDEIDQMKEVTSITSMFKKLVDAPKEAQEILQRQQINEGYVRCRKIIVTPTRKIYIAPEVMMGNRVLRTHGTMSKDEACLDKYQILRVTFRDDDGNKMTSSSTGEKLIEDSAVEALRKGVFIGGRKFSYLGNSNSQMRDHGCYFFMGEVSETESIRRKLGRFTTLPSIAKVVARLGQCFTQSRESTIKLYSSKQRSDYETCCDIIGGCDSKGKAYTFSDGVGQASKEFLLSLSKDLKFQNRFIPSCIQFRFRGGKGVLTMDPVVDEMIAFGSLLGYVNKETGVVDEVLFKNINAPRFHKILFRESQMKFEAPKNRDDSAFMEVVKFSTPTPVALNKPFINILDQVSDMQSHLTHQKVCGRIEALLDRHLRMISMVLIDEATCRNRLKELPHRFDIDRLSQHLGFSLSTEPFFRSLVKACVRFSLHKQLHKEQIQIPHELGRAMFGVVDETGILQYGQIFCRYTVNIGLKNPPASAGSRILKGTVLVTKNPCIVSGDVRLFEAVDVPELTHLRDVIVFPQHGPRPHADEMAGSDLDGDEYSVIWDPDLMFDYNMPPMDFTSEGGISEIQEDEVTEQMILYYKNYMLQDQVGKVANAHLIASDLYGLDSIVAKVIAKKHSEAVDFPKTGKPPDKLTSKWTSFQTGPETTVHVAPERSPRVPDFMEKDHEPVYRSQRMTGKVFRQVKMVQDVLYFTEERDAQLPFLTDPTIFIERWEDYEEEAKIDYANYCAAIRRELDHYGIRTEAELLTGSILEMRNRISDKDQDDMSFFNTTHMIEQKVTSIWTTFRTGFFENTNKDGTKFGDYADVTVLYDKYFIDEENPLHRHCADATIEMKRKAVAYYRVSYEAARHVPPDQGRILSFPWIVWDILRSVKVDNLSMNSLGFEVLESRHFFKVLEKHLSEYCYDHQHKLNEFSIRLNCKRALNIYCKVYDGQGYWKRSTNEERNGANESTVIGITELLFIVCAWARSTKVFENHIRELHMVLIFIQYATGQYPGVLFDPAVHISKLTLTSPEDLTNTRSDDENLPKQILRSPGRLFSLFLQHLGSSAFRSLKSLTFEDMGFEMGFFNDEWLPLSQAARLTYYSMVFSSRFEDLPLKSEAKEKVMHDVIKEDTSFTIELPFEVSQSQYEAVLIKKCGLKDVKLRRKKGTAGSAYANRVRVSSMGTPRAIRKLHKLVTVVPLHNAESIGPEGDMEYARRTQRKIETIEEIDEYEVD